MKIFKQYKESTVETVKSNPYRLADDIDGIGFKTADSIAFKVGVAYDAEARIAAGVRFVLWEATGDGHTFLPERELSYRASELLCVEPNQIERQLSYMQLDGLLYRERTRGGEGPRNDSVYLNSFYHAEQYTARKLAELNRF